MAKLGFCRGLGHVSRSGTALVRGRNTGRLIRSFCHQNKLSASSNGRVRILPRIGARQPIRDRLGHEQKYRKTRTNNLAPERSRYELKWPSYKKKCDFFGTLPHIPGSPAVVAAPGTVIVFPALRETRTNNLAPERSRYVLWLPR